MPWENKMEKCGGGEGCLFKHSFHFCNRLAQDSMSTHGGISTYNWLNEGIHQHKIWR